MTPSPTTARAFPRVRFGTGSRREPLRAGVRRTRPMSSIRGVLAHAPFAGATDSAFPARAARVALAVATLAVGTGTPSTAAAHTVPGTGAPLPSLAPMLERVTPAVVNISARGPERGVNPLLEDPFFRRFFEQREPVPRAPESRGSGVVIDADAGLVVTNHHVVAGAAEIVVTLADGRERRATPVGLDPKADIALLRVVPGGLVELPWADSAALRVGDFCVAIGNPFGLGQTVTSGIVSALGRSGLGIEEFEDFIQTDASINPGNSGGALVNLAGELIGINTAIVGPSGGNVGIGFAIPSNMARELVAELLEHGRVRRGALGITARALTPALARRVGSAARAGVLVESVRRGSPAAGAGLRAGDVIVAIDGRNVRDVAAVRNRIGLVRAGQRLRLDVLRGDAALPLDVTIEVLQFASPLLEGAAFVERRGRDGRRYVAIESLAPDSPVERAGLRAGDIVLAVGERAVDTLDELDAAAEGAGSLVLLVQRGRERRYVRVG